MTTVSGGEILNVSSGQVESGDDILSGGTINVLSGGTASQTQVTDGANLNVSSGGVTVSSVVSGAVTRPNETIFNGGVASGTEVDFFGVQLLLGGTANNTTVSYGGLQIVSSGTTTGTTIISGGSQYLYGTASGTTVIGDAAGDTTTQDVHSGGTAFDTTLSSSGSQFIRAGAAAINTVISSGGFVVLAGTATGTVIESGGKEYVDPYGVDISGTINDGGTQYVSGVSYAQGLASATTINDSGLQFISSGGAASGVIVSGGEQDVYASGSATGTTVYAGAQVVNSGGFTSGTLLRGGNEYVSSGGTASGTVVFGGGTNVASSGGIEISPVISGGTLELAAGAVLSGPVTFGGPTGTLQVDATSLPTNTVSGFVPGDVIDLAGVGFDSNGTATLTSGNVLQISENSQVYQLQLDPSASFSSEEFVLSSDGSGGSDLRVVNVVHVPRTVIESDGSTDLDQVGGNYYLYAHGTATGPEVQYEGTPITTGQFSNWTPIGAERTAGGYEIAWKNASTGQYTVLHTDSNGNHANRIGNFRTVSGKSVVLELVEPSFHQDLNGDGTIGFNSLSFSGTVAGMSGQDTIGTADVNLAPVQQPNNSGTSSGGPLTVADATHSANIALLGKYLASTFVASHDGYGGTTILDPALASSYQHTVLTQPQHA